jgi:hypothetical protein
MGNLPLFRQTGIQYVQRWRGFHSGNKNQIGPQQYQVGNVPFWNFQNGNQFSFTVFQKWDVMTKPDPELLPKAGSRWPRCSKSMITTDVSDGPDGSERRTFECRPCGFRESE